MLKSVITKVICLGALLFMSLGGVSAQTFTAKVVVENIENLSGDIIFAVFKDGSMKFLDKHKVDAAVRKSQKGSVEADFVLPKAKYVFVAFQDENGNKILDTNWIGYPSEPYAISNNHLLPTYHSSEVDISGDVTVRMKLRGS